MRRSPSGGSSGRSTPNSSPGEGIGGAAFARSSARQRRRASGPILVSPNSNTSSALAEALLPQPLSHHCVEEGGIGISIDPSLQSEISNPQRSPSLTSRLAKFWFDDLPPLFGPLRIVFYLSIMTILVFPRLKILNWYPFDDSGASSTFSARSCQGHVDKFAHYKYLDFPIKIDAGVFGWLVAKSGYNRNMFNCQAMAKSLRWGLFLSGIGAGGRIPRIIVAISWWTMFGIHITTWGKSVGHGNNLAGVGMISLCFAENNFVDGWSVDALVWNWLCRKRWLRQSSDIMSTSPSFSRWKGGPSLGGGARKMVLMQAFIVMFCAGLHKLVSFGIPGWLDGSTIYRAVERNSGARWPFLRTMVLNHPVLATMMAITSVVGEIGAIATLISPWWRPFGVLSFVLFHVGIYMIMVPNFVINIATYVLLVDWRSVGFRLFSQFPVSVSNTVDAVSTEEATARTHCICKLAISTTMSKELDQVRSGGDDSTSCNEPPQISSQMKIGAWVYTFISTLLFTTSILRSDSFPFYSWSLYSWHPSRQPAPPFTVQTAKESARKCVTEPPLNPTCLNLGGSRHHDIFPRHLDSEHQVVMILQEDPSVGNDGNGKCKPNEFSAYQYWEPHSCWPNTTDPKNILWRLAKGERSKRRPDSLDQFLGSTRKGLTWRIIDSMAASIHEGPKCFEPRTPKNTTNILSALSWDADPSPLSPSSRLARRIRTKMSREYYTKRHGRSILAVGIFFRFAEVSSNTGPKERYCLLGSSIQGEPTANIDLAYISGQYGEDIPFGDWGDVQMGILLTFGLGLLLFYWRE